MENMKFTEDRLSVMRVEGYLNSLDDRRDFSLLKEMNGAKCAGRQVQKLRGIEMEVRGLSSWRAKLSRIKKTRRAELVKLHQKKRAESIQKSLG